MSGMLIALVGVEHRGGEFGRVLEIVVQTILQFHRTEIISAQGENEILKLVFQTVQIVNAEANIEQRIVERFRRKSRGPDAVFAPDPMRQRARRIRHDLHYPACAGWRYCGSLKAAFNLDERQDRKSTRLNSSHGYISYAAFCLKKK